MKYLLALLLTFLLIGCAEVESGNTVVVTYTGKLANGTIFDSNDPAQGFPQRPFVVVVGSGKVIKGFDEALIGMKEGEEKTIFIKAVDAYGTYDADKVLQVPKRDRFPKTTALNRVNVIDRSTLPREPVIGEPVRSESFEYNITGFNDTHIRLYLTHLRKIPVRLPEADWDSTLVNVTSESFIMAHLLKEGDVVTRKTGLYIVNETNDEFLLTTAFKVGDDIPTSQGIGRIVRESSDNLYLDFNHPLAGNTLQFTIRVDEIR